MIKPKLQDTSQGTALAKATARRYHPKLKQTNDTVTEAPISLNKK